MDSDIGSSLQEVRGQIATVRHSIEQEADAQQKVSGLKPMHSLITGKQIRKKNARL